MTTTPELLRVPTEHAELFKLAMLEAVASSARCVAKAPETFRLLSRQESAESAARVMTEDLRADRKQLVADIELLEQVDLDSSGELDIHADADTLARICETMARQVVGPRIDAALNYSPIDGAELRRLTSSLTWATNHVDDFRNELPYSRRPLAFGLSGVTPRGADSAAVPADRNHAGAP